MSLPRLTAACAAVALPTTRVRELSLLTPFPLSSASFAFASHFPQIHVRTPGPVLGWLWVIEACRQLKVELPVNIKMVFEGMEESGSIGLDEVIDQEKNA